VDCTHFGAAREPLSTPTAHWSTPIATTALPFVACLNIEGTVELRLTA
jgi:hypothetical protein